LRPSTSETPIEFSIQGVRYKVPRNYIIQMDNWDGGTQTLVEFRVTYPGLGPRTPTTEKCLDGPISFTGRQCARQDFFVSNGYEASDEQAFENSRSLFATQRPKYNSFGFETYEYGPENARTVTFRKRVADRWLIVRCLHGASFGETKKNHARAVCTLNSKLRSGNELGYHFYEGQLSVIEDKDSRIRDLIRRFQAN
jgi:hypothetical protein